MINMKTAQLAGINLCVLDCYTEGVKHRRTESSAVYKLFFKTVNILTQPQPQLKLVCSIKFYSHQLMQFFIQLCISLLSYIKIS